MKFTKTTLLACLVLIASFAFAQVEEGDKSMSLGAKNALTLKMGDVNAKETEKAWLKYLKKFGGKTKKEKKGVQIFSDNAAVKGIGNNNNTVDIYSTVTGSGNNVEITVWYDLGGSFLNSSNHAEWYKAGEKLITDFALTTSKTMIEEELKVEEKTLKSEEKTLKGLVGDKKDYEKEIKKCEAKIKEMKAKIEANIKAQETQNAVIKKQNEKVKVVKTKLSKLK